MSTRGLFKFVCTGGPYGDCMSAYRIEIQQPCTIAQFVEFVNSREEWGAVYINPKNWLGQDALASFEYNNHGSNKPLVIPPYFHDMRIARIEAHGGWSAMDYRVYLHE